MPTIWGFSAKKRGTLINRDKKIDSNLTKLRNMCTKVERDIMVGRPVDTMDAADMLQDIEKMETLLRATRLEARKVLEMFK